MIHNLLFKIKWYLASRKNLRSRNKGAVAIICSTFEDDKIGNWVLDRYREQKLSGYAAYVLVAFNKAPMGKHLDDIRDIFIFNNSPEELAWFCVRKEVKKMIYFDSEVMKQASRKTGYEVVEKECLSAE